MPSLTLALIAIPALLIASVLLSKGASRFGIPALSVFLFVGMLVGREGPGGFAFVNVQLAQTLGILALIFILHAGGLGTTLDDVRTVRGSALVLSTIGVVIATALVGVFAVRFLHFEWLHGLLLGATIASTDVAAVFTILRSRSVSLSGRIRPMLELESALNDPMAVFLGVGLLQLIAHAATSIWILVPMFFRQMVLGTVAGIVAGRAIRWAINHAGLEFEGLYPVFSVALVVLLYGLTDAIGGSGFLAVYVAGIVLGNTTFIHKRSLIVFHDGLAWLMQIVMFLTMGLIALPSELMAVTVEGLLLSAFLVFVARPVSVLACLTPFRYNLREQLMVSWGGLRGAVPIVLATYPLIAGTAGARSIFNLVFFVVFISVLLQGATIPAVSRWLQVTAPLSPQFKYPLEYHPTPDVRSELVEVVVPHDSRSVGRCVFELGFPRGALIVLIRRASEVIVPAGNTGIEPDDRLLVFAEPDALRQVRETLSQHVSQQGTAQDQKAN
jgi:potassium/hydrogen antiporter